MLKPYILTHSIPAQVMSMIYASQPQLQVESTRSSPGDPVHPSLRSSLIAGERPFQDLPHSQLDAVLMFLLKISCLCVSAMNLDEINLKTIPNQAVRQRWKTIAICCRFLSLLESHQKMDIFFGTSAAHSFPRRTRKDAQKTEEIAVWGRERMIGKRTSYRINKKKCREGGVVSCKPTSDPFACP